MKNIKLSKAQEEVLNDAKSYIENARKYNTYEEYEYNRTSWYINHGISLKEAWENLKEIGDQGDGFRRYYWQKAREGFALVTANSRTIKKLEELGLIKIENEGGSYPDMIKVLDF